MSNPAINIIGKQMQAVLSCDQMKVLMDVLRRTLEDEAASTPHQPQDILERFLIAKEVEGCSPKTIEYYLCTIMKMHKAVQKPFTQISTDDLREYLSFYELERNAGKVTIDNIRRIMSSFFSWLEDEDYIVKSPVRRIRKVKTAALVKETFSDEELETIREACTSKRDIAIVDLLVSTGMRIGELVGLNRDDINLHERECLVTGKGNKQRIVYFDARAKLHLENYLAQREDSSKALFVSLSKPHDRMTIGGIELRLRHLGRKAGISRVHPHKFRRTTATYAIGKGMPIEQVQKMLGHARIDTTMHYALVNQSNVKASHRRYLS